MPLATQPISDFRGDRLSVRMFGGRGNGLVSDTVALRSAIEKCGEDGLSLYIPHGRYLLDEPIYIPNPITIFGAGKQSVFTIIDEFNDESMRALFRIDSDDVVIDSLFFEGNREGQDQRAVMIGIGADVERCRISRVEMVNTYGYGIQCTGYAPVDMEIVDNLFRNHEGPGYAISVDSGSTRLRINRNVVNGVTETEGGAGGGILVFHPSDYLNFDLEMCDNTVANALGVPLELQRGQRAHVVGNRVYGAGANGISVGACDYLVVKNNISQDQTSYGYEAGAGDHQIWEGNKAINCAIGFVFDNSAGVLRRHLAVLGNMVDTTFGTEGGNGNGFRFINCAEVLCQGNTIIDPLDTAIVFVGTGDGRSSGDILDNVIHFVAPRPDNAPIGIQLGNKTWHTKIRGNRITVDAAADNSDLGYLGPIIITNTTYYPEITGNIITRDTETGYSPHKGISVQSGGVIVQGRIHGNVIRNFNTGISTENTTGVCDLSDNDVSTCLVPYEIHANHLVSGKHLFTGDVGVGIEPTARLHIAAGTATAGDAPLKLTSGPLLTTPEAGAKEFDGNFEYFTVGSSRYTNERMLQTSFTPTTAGWYRIMAGVNYIGGVLRVEGFVDNYRSDIECVYGQMAYGNRGTLHLLKIANYPGLDEDLISQIRISNNDSLGEAYLDIYVRSSTVPAIIRAYCIGPNNNGIVTAPVVGASAGPDNVQVIGTSRYPSICEPLLMQDRTLRGTPLANLLEADSSGLYFTNASGTRKALGIDLTIVNNRIVQTDSSGGLICDKIELGNDDHVELPAATAGDVLTWNGSSVASSSIESLGALILDEIKESMLSYIQGEIEISKAQVTDLEDDLTDITTAIAGKSDAGHIHGVSTALVGTPEEHSHTTDPDA